MARPPAGYRTKDGKRVPGATTICKIGTDPGGLIHWAWQCGVDGIDYRKARDEAADVGSLIHDAVDLVLKHGKPADEVRETFLAEAGAEVVVGFDSFCEWYEQVRFEPLATEVSLVSEKHGFGGTFDALGRVGDRLALADWKSGRCYPDQHAPQLAAYCALWEEHHPDERVERFYILRFDKNTGSFMHYSWPRSVIDAAWSDFLLRLGVYRARKSYKGLA